MIRWKQPKTGIFKIDNNKYHLSKGGWQHDLKEVVVIGETKDTYIERFMETSCGFWEADDTQYTTYYTMALGVHKSRFVQWKEGTQLTFKF